MQPKEDERQSLASVQEFVQQQYPGSVVILHASVCWDDQIFTPLSEKEARELGIAQNKCVRAELTPDYAVFALDDVVCAYKKTRKGKSDLRIEKGSPEFTKIAEYEKHIPYIHNDEPGFKVPKGRVTVIAVRPGTRAIAVLDHKGGKKDFNSRSSRRRALIQGKRFSTNNVYIVTNNDGEVNETMLPKVTYVTSIGGNKFFRLLYEPLAGAVHGV